jgi:hypothetical protein
MTVALVGVEQVAKVFRVSPRQVQKFAEIEGMPREAHGKYDLGLCMVWFIQRLHRKVCGCAGPCEGFSSSEKEMANRRAERKSALKEIVGIADDLVGLDATEISERLKDAIKQAYEDIQFTQEKK